MSSTHSDSAEATGRSRPRGRGRETRRRIVETAYHLMSARGYVQTTMAEVAAAAGVAVPTVYFSFRSKPALFAEVFARAVKGDGGLGPTEQPWFGEFVREPEVGRAIAGFVVGTTEILERTAPLWAVLQGLSEDPELAAFKRDSESLRRAGFRRVIDLLAEKSPLRTELARDDATDILLTFLSPDVYRSFTRDHAWSVERWQRWTTEVVLTVLFGPPEAVG